MVLVNVWLIDVWFAAAAPPVIAPTGLLTGIPQSYLVPEGTISVVECVTHHKCPNNEANLCKIGDLLITPFHPVYINNQWRFPIDISPSEKFQCNYVINLVLQDRKSINIKSTDNSNIACCTLGHGIEGDVIGHTFFGTERIIENFRNNFPNEYENGLVTSTNVIQRNRDTGLVEKYL